MRPYSRRANLFAALLTIPLLMLPLGCGSGGTIPAPLTEQSRAVTETFPVDVRSNYFYKLTLPLTENSEFELFYKGAPLVPNQDYRLNREVRYFQLLRPFPQDSEATGNSLQAKYTGVHIPLVDPTPSVY
jgi:hypothetical protein